jgi:hypothetical protein
MGYSTTGTGSLAWAASPAAACGWVRGRVGRLGIQIMTTAAPSAVIAA